MESAGAWVNAVGAEVCVEAGIRDGSIAAAGADTAGPATADAAGGEDGADGEDGAAGTEEAGEENGAEIAVALSGGVVGDVPGLPALPAVTVGVGVEVGVGVGVGVVGDGAYSWQG